MNETEVFADDLDGERVAECYGSGHADEANARLIAAAPDLLEALRYARRFLNSEHHDTAYVDAAITRATGAQP